jgi:uncharacterized protein YecE (DUF72 family)
MILVGTSGYNYSEWKGSFYPEDLSSSKMLPYYADRFHTVEINYSFYRLPSEKAVSGWADQTPDDFVFTLKASRRITHDARLRDCKELVDVFCERGRRLGDKLGTILFQLPPWARKDVEALEQFLEWLPSDVRGAFEFRHDSWLSDDVYDRLRANNAALCITDTDKASTPMVMTADYAYFRLRDEGYGPDDIAEWGRKITEHTGDLADVFVYFKHEKEGKGADFARTLIDSLEA